MVSLPEVNEALVRALGFGELKGITGLVLQLSGDRPPVVTVQRAIVADGAAVADALATVTDRYELKPVASAPEVPANV